MRLLRALKRRISSRRTKAVISSSGLFDREWYLSTYPDIKAAGADPVEHYIRCGAAEGRDPGPYFSTAWYREEYPDIVISGVNPLLHYVLLGKQEGRLPLPEKAERIRSLVAKPLPQSKGDRPSRIASVLHIYYPDLADELLDACLNVPGGCDIFATVVTQECQDICSKWAAKHPEVKVNVKLTENKGRNVSSFTAVWGSYVLDHYDLFVHVHTKKSVYTGAVQHSWRRSSLEALLGSQEQVGQILQLFSDDPKLGIVGPLPHESISYWGFTWTSNAVAAAELSKLLGLALPRRSFFDFPAGCMFWARPVALRELLDGHITADSFPEEKGQNDGTIMHAIERSLYMLSKVNGFTWAEVDYGLYWPEWGDKNIWQYVEGTKFEKLAEKINSSLSVSFGVFDTLLVDLTAGARGTGIAVTGREEYLRRERVVEAFDLAISRNKPVFIVCDTTSPREEIEQLLASFGISGWSAIYCSSETGKTKSSGDLWKHLLEKERLEGARHLHIGSKIVGDVQVPGDMWIPNFHVLSSADMFWLSKLSRAFPDNVEVPPAMAPSIAFAFNDPFFVGALT